MTSPSSPVPAVEADRIELPGGWYFQQLNPPHGVLYALRTPKGKGFGINGTGMSVGRPVVEAFAAAMSSTPSRATEPDTMGEVKDLLYDYLKAWKAAGDAKWPGVSEQAASDTARDALLSAVQALRTRAETAEAEVATQGWQPITTCPNDGRNVWVCGGPLPEPDQRGADGAFWNSSLCPRSPTHWAPCQPPAPPLSTSGADR